MKKRKAITRLSLELFQEKLGIRSDLWINDIEINQFDDTVKICICGPDLPEVCEGATPQQIDYSLLTSVGYEVVDKDLTYMAAIEKIRKGKTIRRKNSDIAYSISVCTEELTIQGYDLKRCCKVDTFFSSEDALANDWQTINLTDPLSTSSKKSIKE